MIRAMALALMLSALTACTTPGGGNSGSGSDRLEMTGLEEMSLEYIKTKWGDPDTNVPKGEGRVVHYKNIQSRDEDPVTRKVTLKSCVVRLDLTKDQLVKNWEYENCRIIPSGK